MAPEVVAMPKPVRPAPGPVVRRPSPSRAAARAVAGAVAGARANESALRREAEELLAIVEQRKRGIGVSFYEIGRALTELLDRKLYVLLGHGSFAAMVEDRKLLSRALAWRLVAVYRSIPKALAQKLGPEKAFEWLQVLKLEAGAQAAPADVQRLAAAKPEVSGRPVAELSSNDLAAFREKMELREAVARRDPGATAAHRAARALAQRLKHLGADDARVTARFSRNVWRIRAEMSVDDAQALSGGK
jgi:hypothetical protein